MAGSAPAKLHYVLCQTLNRITGTVCLDQSKGRSGRCLSIGERFVRGIAKGVNYVQAMTLMWTAH